MTVMGTIAGFKDRHDMTRLVFQKDYSDCRVKSRNMKGDTIKYSIFYSEI